MTFDPISPRKTLSHFLSLRSASGTAKLECKAEQVLFQEELSAFKQHSTILPLALCGGVLKIAVAAVSFLQVCLLFQWLSSGAQNRPLSLPLFISLCFSFSHSAQTRYKNYQFAYEIGWKAKLVELH